jgi:molybdenum cofactor guanylyltransferase
MKSCIILCGGRSKRMGRDKGIIPFQGKPMIFHVLDSIENVVDDIILVLRDEEQVRNYTKILGKRAESLRIYIDQIKDGGPLVGILTGLSNIKSDYALTLPCDSPFIDESFVLNIFELEKDEEFDAIVPRWENGHIEPIHSMYKKSVLKTISKLLKDEINDVKSLIENLNVRYVDVRVLDETTRSFQNINTLKDINTKIGF